MTTIHTISRPADLGTVRRALDGALQIGLDTETVYRAELTDDGIPGTVRVVTIGCRDISGALDVFVIDLRDVPPAALAPVIAGIEADAWNAGFDEYALELVGCSVAGWWDAMLADALLRLGAEGMTWYASLADAARAHLGVTLWGKGEVQTSFDATSDLTADQVRYAAQDVVVTMRLAAMLRDLVAQRGLTEVCNLEMAARPVIARMQRVGFPFDQPAWQAELDDERVALFGVLETLAALTGETDAPSWNPASDAELRAVLNTHAHQAVMARYGRELEPGDSLDRQALTLLDHPLADAVLTWREHTKVLNTYGENLDRFVRDGRVRPRYKQAIVSTGRLASFSPNGQNLSPRMKPHIRPAAGRVFVHGDLSQAELRMLAQLSGETVMREAFASGEDFHARVSGTMFGVDMGALRLTDPARYKQLRSQAKALSFGQVYGMAARALSTTLTTQGVPTSKEEAARLLENFNEAFPRVHEWLTDRDTKVRTYARQHQPVDWVRTMRLAELRTGTEGLRKQLKRKTGSTPTSAELATAWQDKGHEAGVEPSVLAADLDAAYAYDDAIVVGRDGKPIGFVSRTPWGRRRVFQVAVDTVGNDQFSGVATNAVLELCTSKRPAEMKLVAEFSAEHNLDLPTSGDRLARRVRIAKAFSGKNRPLRFELLRLVHDRLGPRTWEYLLGRGCAAQIGSLANAYRNHPIQGAVADVVLAALAELHVTLPPSAVVVMSVHDSIVVEVDTDDADRAATAVKQALEGAMARACPDVVVVADVDVRATLADADVLTHVT